MKSLEEIQKYDCPAVATALHMIAAMVINNGKCRNSKEKKLWTTVCKDLGKLNIFYFKGQPEFEEYMKSQAIKRNGVGKKTIKEV